MQQINCFKCRMRAERRHPCVVFVGNVGLYIYGDENKLGRSVYGVEYYEIMALGMEKITLRDIYKEVETWPYGVRIVDQFIDLANLDDIAFASSTK